ncbi:ACP S-malonyltransferase [Georgenia sp. SYP-B2076]|uniref:ACP S-malonyltransferase n=1 Tax=Georgenia sp. SYP-B2076 TaxID=2495881 RepID=UPI0035190F0A
MLASWLEVPSLRTLLDRYSAVTELDLAHLGTDADAETIKDTRVAQALLTAASLLSWHALTLDAGLPRPDAVAGHSVGELAASAVAGVLSDEQALLLVRERGLAMADAAATEPTGMTALVGGDPEEVTATLARLGLTAANVNGGGQVVAAGTRAQLDALSAAHPAKARVVPLEVAGAFHTEHMRPAVARVREMADSLSPADPTTALLSNADGAVVTSGEEALSRMVTQVANPVRWDLCCEQLLALGVTGVVELCPGGVLTRLARRTLPGVESVAIKRPGDLPAARELMTRHGGSR